MHLFCGLLLLKKEEGREWNVQGRLVESSFEMFPFETFIHLFY